MSREPSTDGSSDTPTAAASERRTINCRVSADAYDAWSDFCEARGVSLTAVLEAIAFEMRQLHREKDMEPVEVAIVDHARRIDANVEPAGAGRVANRRRQVREARVFGITDPSFDPAPTPVERFEVGDVGVG